MKNSLLLLLVLAFAIISCEDDDDSSNTDTYAIPASGKAVIDYSVLKSIDGFEVRNGGWGSGAVAHPTMEGHFYALTDRGPNTDFQDGKKFPVADYSPRIGHFKLNSEGKIELVREIIFKNPDGTNMSGLPNPAGKGSTGEVPYDYSGNKLDFQDWGIDSEGIVALKDGTFWVSDEYGPHIAHFDANGKQLERISPIGVETGTRKLPAVYAKRRANRGMEGLAITPDENVLVGIMQSTMNNPTSAGSTNKTLTRIVTFNLTNGEVHEYLYKQNANNFSNSEISALTDKTFLVIERDGNYPGETAAIKHIYKIDLSTGTDITKLVGYNVNLPTGYLVNNKELEASTWAELETAGITPVSKELVLNVTANGDYFHDKLEGIWVISPTQIALLNDDDFAVVDPSANVIAQKFLPGTANLVDYTGVYFYTVPALK